MPNRILREGILDSDKVDMLSWPAECFYRRLMSAADDFGRFDGRLEILRSKLFPLRLDRVSKADIEKWLAECAGAALVSCYTVDAKPYLEVLNFKQEVRIKKSKFPPPNEKCVADGEHMSSICAPETKPNETETETKQNQKSSENTRANVLNLIYKDLFADKEKYFPELIAKYNAAWKILSEKKLSPEKHSAEDEKLFNLHYRKPVKAEIEKMWNWYHKTTAHKKVDDWSSAMRSWLDRKGEFKR